MYLHTKSGKKLISLLAAMSAFVMIQSAVPLAVNAAFLTPPPSYTDSAVPASGGTTSYGKGTVTASYLNVRSGRGKSYSVVAVIPKGTSVTLQEEKDGWYKVTYSGKTGWISAEYVKVSATLVSAKSTTTTAAKTTATSATASSTQTTATAASTASTTAATTAKAATTTTAASSTLGSGTVTADYLYVRSGPGTNYSVVGGLGYGKSVQALEKSGSWVKVKLSGDKTGWVSASYVKFGTVSTTAKTTATTKKSTTTTTKKATTTTKKATTTTKKATTTTKKATTTTKNSNTSTSATGKIVITGDVLNARSSASQSASIVGTVRRNEVYTYSAVKDGWYKITIPSGATAYVSGQYVKKFSDYAVKGGGSYLWPVQAYSRISSYFGPRNGSNHYGLDIAAPAGSQIMAVAGGTVITNSYEGNGFGYYIVIQQSDGIRTYYGHMKAASFLKKGATVKAGDTIGLVGSTGRSTGNHLHLEFRRGSTKIDPLNYYPNMK